MIVFKFQGVNNVKCVALINDTVGCMISGAYEDEQTKIGVILGTPFIIWQHFCYKIVKLGGRFLEALYESIIWILL